MDVTTINKKLLVLKKILLLEFSTFVTLHIKKKTNFSLFFSFIAPHDALFIVGALDEALLLRGLRYHPIDIEMSVVRAHKSICEW